MTFFHFGIEFTIFGLAINGAFFFIPLLVVCLTLFLLTFFLRSDLRNFQKDDVLRVIIFIIGISLVFYFLGLAFLEQLAFTLFIISIFSFVLITAIFTIDTCYNAGVKLDDGFRKAPKAPRGILRGGFFLGGILISILIIYYLVDAGYQMELQDQITTSIIDTAQINAILIIIPWVIIYSFLGIALYALLVFIIRGKFNAWLGLFFVMISIYVALIMYKAFKGSSTGENLYSSVYMSIGMFILDILLVLISIAGLIGEKGESISDRLKVIKADAILIWVLFAKAAYEYANIAIDAVQVSSLKTIGVFVLFVPLMILGALSGIISYKKGD